LRAVGSRNKTYFLTQYKTFIEGKEILKLNKIPAQLIQKIMDSSTSILRATYDLLQA